MKTFEATNRHEKRERRMPADVGILEAMRLKALGRRAYKLAPGDDYVGLDQKRTARVIKHPGLVAIEIDKAMSKTETVRRQVQITWGEESLNPLPHIKASEIRTRTTHIGDEVTIYTKSFNASNQPSENTLGLGDVAQVLHEAKQLQSAEVA